MEKYFTDKSQIYLHQTKDDFLICGEKIAEKIGKINSHPSQIKNKFDGARKIITRASDVPKDWKVKIPGDHNLENIACAIAVARVLKIEEKIIKKAVENFIGVEGRLEFLREYKGIKIYNDTTATTPDATIVALKGLNDSIYNLQSTGYKKIILILGGADKNLDMSGLVKEIPKYCKSVILLSGTGTIKIENEKIKMQNENPKLKINKTENLKKAVTEAIKECKRGDTLLFSPAFASFGMFKNEFDRGEQFVKIIKKL
jgi:UDP-N-acetylmuramoylalanine--D-glutamate ligase